jgi:hypothetical protein
MDDFRILKKTVLAVQVCSSLSLEETTKRLNAELPTGIDSQWAIGDGDSCKGADNPVACAECPTTHKHYVFVC